MQLPKLTVAFAGSVALAIGMAPLALWPLDRVGLAPALVRSLPMPAVAFCFVLLGIQLLAPRRRLARIPLDRALPAGLVLIPLVALVLDGDTVARLHASASGPSMHLTAAAGFIGAGLGIALVAYARHAALRGVVYALVTAATLVGLLDLATYVPGMDSLLDRYSDARMRPWTAASMILAGIALTVQAHTRMPADPRADIAEDRKIALFSTVLLLCLASGSGVLGFSLLARTAQDVLTDSLQVSLRHRLAAFEAAVAHAAGQTLLISQRPRLNTLMDKLSYDTLSTAERREIEAIVDNIQQTVGASAIALHDAAGRFVSRRGEFSAPEFEAELHGWPGHTLIHAGRLVVRGTREFHGSGRPAGTIRTEIPVPAIEQLFEDVTGLGDTGTMAVCAPLGVQMQCLPNRSNGHKVLKAPRHVRGEPVPMAYALEGKTGTVITNDAQHRNVLAAHAPIGSLGLGMIVKVRRGEIYAPIRAQLLPMVGVVLLVTVAGVLLLRWQVVPLARKLVREIAERRQAERALRASDERFRQLTALSSDWYWEQDAHYRFTRIRRNAEAERRFPARDSLGKTRWELPYVDVSEETWRMHRATLEARRPFHGLVLKRRDVNGEVRYSEVSGEPFFAPDGAFLGYRGTGRDITELKRAEDAVARLGRILDDSSNEIYVFNANDLRIVQVNRGAQRNLGYSLEELKGLTPVDLKPEFDRDSFEALLTPLRRGEQETTSFVTQHRRRDGSVYPVEVRLQLSRHDEPPVFVAIVQDITERKQSEEQLRYLAYHDGLTGLPNRLKLTERLRQAAHASGEDGLLTAVLLLDLDRFKTINDTLGHEAGDVLLRTVAERLAACVRPGDSVARIGGDEFVVVLSQIAEMDEITGVTQRILASFGPAFQIGARELFTSASVGIAVYPLDAREPEGLLKHADAAMYEAKESGRNTFRFYTAELNARAQRRLRLETDLRRALDRNELLLHFQPQLDLATGRIVAAEALLRWQHPELGLLPPGDFISLAEETGLIVPIGEWVLREACTRARGWHAAGFKRLRVAVNLSGRQFMNHDLSLVVKRTIEETGLAPRYLELELTESLLMHNVEAAAAMLRTLDGIGVTFSMDDFGTGYSSLAYLKRFPLDLIKIDRTFVRDITTDPDDAAITKTIIAMAHSLDMRVIAEGVETEDQLAFLRAHGCDAIQGYCFSPPVSPEAFLELLGRQNRAPGPYAQIN
ncbi:EAL domain-containing protein [Sulfurifustis variabilis]|nr:EAL domain-containing protein [Sulfurifustis variabilis]